MQRAQLVGWVPGWSVLLLTVVAGCNSTPVSQRPTLPIPGAWADTAGQVPPAAAATGSADSDWWAAFADPQLQQLLKQALADAPDLRIASERMLAAHDAVKIARSYRYPSLDFKAGPTDPVIPRLARDDGNHPRASDDHFELGLEASYEIDFWGRISNSVAAARAGEMAGMFDAEAARLALQSTVANAYFDLRENDEALDLQTRRQALDAERVRLLQLRLDAGRIAMGPMTEAQLAAQATAARIDELHALRQGALLELDTLLGDTALSLQLEPQNLRGHLVPPEVPVGLPSMLLERRPDVRAAEARLAAAESQIAVARAERFPQVRLTAELGYLTASVNHLLHSGSTLIGIGPEVSVPLFDGGRRVAEVDARRHEYEAARAEYRKSVTAAFSDTEKALLARQSSLESAQRCARTQSLQATQLKRLQSVIDAGHADRLQLIEAQEQALQTDEAALHAYRAGLDNAVALYQALGGDWRNAPKVGDGADDTAPDLAKTTAATAH